ncbi:MAG: lysostaphin resistance A-like protein [Bacteroidota bacterium]
MKYEPVTLESVVPEEGAESTWFSLIRVATFLGVTFAGIAVLYGLLVLILPGSLGRFFDGTFKTFAFLWTLGTTLAFWGVVEEKTLPDMGLLPRRSELLAGLAVGFCSVLLLYGLGLVTGLIRFAPGGGGFFGALLGALGFTLAWVMLEEILFRGYLLQTLLTDMPPWLAALIASFLYAQIHLIKPGQPNVLLPFVGFFLTGLVLCYAYLLTENLFLPIGLHASWCFFQAFSNRLHLWSYPNAFWTGAGNPQTGILGIAVILFVALALRFVYGPTNWTELRD